MKRISHHFGCGITVSLVLALLLPGCQNPQDKWKNIGESDEEALERYRKLDAKEAATYEHVKPLLMMCRAASRMEVFEGLPHTMFEQEAVKRELLRPDIMMNHDFGFYTPALAMGKDEQDRFCAEVCSETSYVPWTGEKRCGGFHPDLLLRCHTVQGVVDIHLCFGCGEAILYGPRKRARVDIVGVGRWKEFQENHRTKRPQRQ